MEVGHFLWVGVVSPASLALNVVFGEFRTLDRFMAVISEIDRVVVGGEVR